MDVLVQNDSAVKTLNIKWNLEIEYDNGHVQQILPRERGRFAPGAGVITFVVFIPDAEASVGPAELRVVATSRLTGKGGRKLAANDGTKVLVVE